MAKKDDMQRRIEMIQEAQRSMQAYQELLRSIRELEENISYVKARSLELTNEIVDAEEKLRNPKKYRLTKDEVDALLLKVAALKDALKQEEKILAAAEKEVELRREAANQVNELALGLNSVYAATKRLGNLVLRQGNYWLEQQKAVKETELSMGILSNQAKGFRDNMFNTSKATLQLGVNTKELSKLQGTYADNVGRAIQLNEAQLTAIAEIGKGTMLGTEAAAELAANFEQIGIGAEGTADFIQESLDLSTKMGISASKTIKNIQKNFRLLNKYNFQGGVEGFGKMAALATKFKFEMESIAGFADDLMTPEGAVEVASKLQVLGGEWAKLGDPFELMYRSRNDLGGLTEDIINATKATARFDETTGEFRIDPMELHRLREVANVTGLSAEELAEMAKQTAKFDKIESLIPKTFSDEDKEYMSSLAQFNKKTGEFEISLNTPDGKMVTESITSLNKITPQLIKSQKDFQQTLEDRAKQSLTFTERFENLVQSFQSAFLPAFDAFATALEESIGDFHSWAENEGMLDKLTDFGTKIGEFAASVVKFVTNNPITTVVGLLIGKAALWYARGVQLGIGFNSVANVGGGFGNMFGGKGKTAWGGKPGKIPKGFEFPKQPKGRFGKFGNVGKGNMTFGKSLGKGLKAGGVLGIGALAADLGRGALDDPNSDFGRGLGVAGQAAEWASYGALLGSIIPGLGTAVGGVIGGGAGLIKGLFDEGVIGDGGKTKQPSMFNDFIMRPNEEAISFSPQDTVVGAKEGGPIDKMLGQVENINAKPGNNIISLDTDKALVGMSKTSDLANLFEGKDTVNTGSSEVKVKFEDVIKIDGKIEVSSGNERKQINLDDPILMQNLSRMIMEELSKAIGGGKLASNPVPA